MSARPELGAFANAMMDVSASFAQPPNFKMPYIPTLAESVFETLKSQIEEFQNGLDNDHEIAFWMVPFGQQELIVNVVGYRDPMIVFFGEGKHGPFRLIQHFTQLNFALQAVRKKPDRVAKRVGFWTPSDEAEDAAS